MHARFKKPWGPITLLWGSRRLRWAVLAVLAAPTLYVLSFGPACWLVDGGSLPIGPTARMFCPLVVAALEGPELIRRPLNWCGSLFDAPPEPTILFMGYEVGIHPLDVATPVFLPAAYVVDSAIPLKDP
jgi:hypothetical protein